MPMSPKRYLSFAFPHQHPTRSYPLPIHATCPAHLIFHISTPSLQTYITNRITLIGFAQELAEFRCAASISKNGNYKNDVLNLLTIVSSWKSKKLSCILIIPLHSFMNHVCYEMTGHFNPPPPPPQGPTSRIRTQVNTK